MDAFEGGLLFFAGCIVGAWGYSRLQERIEENHRTMRDLLGERTRLGLAVAYGVGWTDWTPTRSDAVANYVYEIKTFGL